MHWTIHPRRVVTLLAWIVAIISVLGLAGQIAEPHLTRGHLRRVVHLVDLDAEWNIASWYATLTLLGAAGLLGLIAAAVRRRRGPFVRHWQILALVFVYLSFDEAVGIHELVTVPARAVVRTGSWLPFTWVVPAGVLVGLLGLLYLPFLRHLPRRIAVWFVVAGAVYVAGAIGMEVASGLVLTTHDGQSLAYELTAATEEVLEMVGVLLFIRVLLIHLADEIDELRITIAPAGVRSEVTTGPRS